MSDSQETVLSDDGDGARTIDNAVEHCVAELRGTGPAMSGSGPATVAGIGTTAPHALKGALLLQAMARAGVDLASTVPYDDPAALLADPQWDLALVLSPWKQTVAAQLDAFTDSASRTGVVDTIIRGASGPIGVNTNSWAAQAAMETVMGGRAPASVLVLGSGGSSNSVALGVRRAWPDTRLIGSARNPAALGEWAKRFGAASIRPSDLAGHRGVSSSLIVNTTTWGETTASEESPFMVEINDLLAPGNGYFDLNNRISSLQTAALDAGCNVMSGTFMQRVTNACRAALLKARL